MRAFIAIELPSELKDKIAKIISELQAAQICDAKWVLPQRAHLTLKFLGELREPDIGQVRTVLEKIATAAKAFDLQLTGLGHFKQRVLWVGGGSGQAEAAELAKQIDEELSKLGFEKETRPFTIHLTLARIVLVKDRVKFKQVLEKYQGVDFGALRVDKIALMRSTLTPRGPVYSTLAQFMLSS